MYLNKNVQYIIDLINESIDEDLYNARNNTNWNPTEKQKKTGNYKKGHININGFKISIESPKGSTRSGKDPNGHEWSIQMPHDYGYFTKTKGKDTEFIDVYIGDDLESKDIYVVDQKLKGKFDESKVMFCFDSEEKAKQGYLDCYEKDWKGFWKITKTTLPIFKKWLYDGHMQYKPFFQYKEIIDNKKKEKLNENYSSKYVEPTIDKHINGIFNWINNCKNGKYNEYKPGIYTVHDEYKTNLKPFKKGEEYMQQKYLKNFKIPVTYYFEPDREIQFNCNGITKGTGENLKIDIFFNNKITPEILKSVISHEITHFIDYKIKFWKSSWGVNKNIKYHDFFEEGLNQFPDYIRKPIYYLWTTTEFNAWQSSINVFGNSSNFMEYIIDYLNQANQNNNPKLWIGLKHYLTDNNMPFRRMGIDSIIGKNYSNMPWESIKKYFIKTSFNKLKKFIKKCKN